MLYTKALPTAQKYQLNRFRCVYKDWKVANCLYDVWTNKFKDFDINKPIVFEDCSNCPKTWLENCLTDKIKLVRV